MARAGPPAAIREWVDSVPVAGTISGAWLPGQTNLDRSVMNIHLDADLLQPAIALVAGILILAAPRLLNFVVAIYLILVGVTGLWPHLLR
jgi:hypothetical protein